jgi:1-acyl-sn-glycerol-3-phosphate acyltransferase
MTLGFSLRAAGARNIPRSGPALLLANHQSFLDPMLVGVSIVRRHMCALARSGLFSNPAFGWLIRNLGAAPINQEGFSREGLKSVLDNLQVGRTVLIFPEGERCADGVLHPLRPGVSLIIKKASPVPIVPIGIAGAFDAWPRQRPYPIPAPLFLPPGRGTIAVSIGEPLDSRYYADLPRDQMLAELFVEMQKAQLRAERLRRR